MIIHIKTGNEKIAGKNTQKRFYLVKMQNNEF